MNDHNHDDPETLTWGCDGCIERIKRDQFTATLETFTEQDLADVIMARDHLSADWMCDAVHAEVARREHAQQVTA